MPNVTDDRRAAHQRFYSLARMDSNHDYLIQSQAGYRYPTGQCLTR
jgi:hypothetical protein